MARSSLRLDVPGLVDLRNSVGVRTLLSEVAEDVAEAARAAPETQRHRMPVRATLAKAGRRRASAVVGVMHPGGLGVQAKHGTLSRAVAAVGLSRRKVRRRP